MVKAGNEPGGNMSRYVRHGSLGKTTDCRCYWTGCSKTEPTNIEWRQPAGWVCVGKRWRERLIAEGLMTKRGTSLCPKHGAQCVRFFATKPWETRPVTLLQPGPMARRR